MLSSATLSGHCTATDKTVYYPCNYMDIHKYTHKLDICMQMNFGGSICIYILFAKVPHYPTH